MTLAAFVAFWSGVLGRPVQPQMVVLGSMSLGGNVVLVENLAESLQVPFDAGARKTPAPRTGIVWQRVRGGDTSQRHMTTPTANRAAALQPLPDAPASRMP